MISWFCASALLGFNHRPHFMVLSLCFFHCLEACVQMMCGTVIHLVAQLFSLQLFFDLASVNFGWQEGPSGFDQLLEICHRSALRD